jgi:hypothetical protein
MRINIKKNTYSTELSTARDPRFILHGGRAWETARSLFSRRPKFGTFESPIEALVDNRVMLLFSMKQVRTHLVQVIEQGGSPKLEVNRTGKPMSNLSSSW